MEKIADTLKDLIQDENSRHVKIEKIIKDQLSFYHKLHLYQLQNYYDKTRRRNIQIKNLKNDNVKLKDENDGLAKSLIEKYSELERLYKRIKVLEEIHSVK